MSRHEFRITLVHLTSIFITKEHLAAIRTKGHLPGAPTKEHFPCVQTNECPLGIRTIQEHLQRLRTK